MIKLTDKLNIYVSKYKEKVRTEIQNVEFEDITESTNHVKIISLAGKGDPAAKEYVLTLIKKVINANNLMEKEDIFEIGKLIKEEYKILINKTYKTYPSNEQGISYYQLVDLYMKDADKEKIKRYFNNDNINVLDEFIDLIYKETYGDGILENLLNLFLNNIEVHGTRKIYVETPQGEWKFITDYKFNNDKEIVRIASNIMKQDGESTDLTSEESETEGEMANGNRVTILLKPGCEDNYIAIKMSNTFGLKGPKDLLDCGEVTEEMYEDIEIYAKYRSNNAIIGGINVGKTQFLRAYAGLVPDDLKLRMIESDFETHLQQLYPNKDIQTVRATKKYSLTDQFIKILRMNGQVLYLGESRSFEVEEWIKAMTRGNDGSSSTLHSRTAHDLINNMSWMILENGRTIDIRVLRYRVACALDIVIRIRQLTGGKRIVDEIDEIETVHDNLDMPYKINKLYSYDLKTKTVKKVGKISNELADKFRYYGCTEEELEKIGVRNE